MDIGERDKRKKSVIVYMQTHMTESRIQEEKNT